MFNKKKKAEAEKAKKLDKEFKGETGRLTSGYAYEESDPYIKVGRSYMSVFDVLFLYGTHRADANVGWENVVIPRDQIPSGEVFFVQRQRGMEKSTEDAIITKRLAIGQTAVDESDTTDAREQTKSRDKSADYDLAKMLSGNNDTIVDSDMRLIIKAKSPELVEKTLNGLYESYKTNDVHGVQLIRRTGDQIISLKKLFTEVSADKWHPSDMAFTAAGRVFLPSSGFSDETGVYVGRDTRSILSKNPSVIDFRNVHNAIIFTGQQRPKVSLLAADPDQISGGANLINGGSFLADTVADGNYLNGQRTHHIILSPDTNYELPERREQDSLYFDMLKQSLNPMEVYGTFETVTFDANANFTKLVNMFLLLAGEFGNKQLANDLENQLRDFYINIRGIYSEHPESDPIRARQILATPDHQNYPKPVDFLASLLNYRNEQTNVGTAMTQERSTVLYDNINGVFRRYSSVFSSTTTLPDSFKSSDRNIYYDISHTQEDPKIRAALFMNTLAYVSHRALPGEMIVIHGIDYADIPLEAIIPYKQRMIRKNVGLVTVFETSENDTINPSTFRDFSGRLSQQDFVILGRMSKKEADYLGDLWDNPLPMVIRQSLENPAVPDLFYFYRKSDATGAIIQADLLR